MLSNRHLDTPHGWMDRHGNGQVHTQDSDLKKKSERNWLFMYIEKGNLITSLKPNVASVYFFFQCTYIVTACGMNDDGLVLVKVFKIFRAANLGKRKTVSDHCQLRA